MSALSLALAHENPSCAGAYHDKTIAEYVRAAMTFWKSIQNRDGSFNEWYPNEHSHVATAFTLWGVTEAMLRMDETTRAEMLGQLERCFRKAAAFLDRHIDTVAINHTAGAIAALYNLYELTKDSSLLEVIQRNKAVVIANQDPEGWYSEYGDPDIGYQSLSILFLASYWKKSGDKEIFTSLQQAVDFLSCFIHVDGSSGGEYASRNTKYLFKYGLRLLAQHIPKAAVILDSIDVKRQANIMTTDDRYFIFFFLPDLLLSDTAPLLPSEHHVGHEARYRWRHFDRSGLVVFNTDTYQFICNLRKGGPLKLFDRRKKELALSSLGYMGEKSRGKLITTQAFAGSTSEITDTGKQKMITINVPFTLVSMGNPLRNLFVFFRAFNHLFERWLPIHLPFDRYLKQHRVKGAKVTKGCLRRTIILKENSVKITDLVSQIDTDSTPLREIHELSFRFVPTSQYSLTGDCHAAPSSGVKWEQTPEGYIYQREFLFT